MTTTITLIRIAVMDKKTFDNSTHLLKQSDYTSTRCIPSLLHLVCVVWFACLNYFVVVYEH